MTLQNSTKKLVLSIIDYFHHKEKRLPLQPLPNWTDVLIIRLIIKISFQLSTGQRAKLFRYSNCSILNAKSQQLHFYFMQINL